METLRRGEITRRWKDSPPFNLIAADVRKLPGFLEKKLEPPNVGCYEVIWGRLFVSEQFTLHQREDEALHSVMGRG